MRGDLEADEKIWVAGRDEEDGSKRTSQERCESGYCVKSNIERNCYRISPYDDCQLFVGKPIHVYIRNGI